MLWRAAIVLVVIVVFGLDVAYALTLGGFIQLLVVVALGLLLVRVLENQRV